MIKLVFKVSSAQQLPHWCHGSRAKEARPRSGEPRVPAGLHVVRSVPLLLGSRRQGPGSAQATR